MSIARASSSAKAERQARSGDVSPCVGSSWRTLMSMPGALCAKCGEKRRQEYGRNAVRSADREPARGPGGIERLGGRKDAPYPRENVRDRAGQFRRAGCRHDALGRLEKQRIVEESAQPAEAVTDRRRRKAQPFCRSADMALLQHGLEEDQKVEVGARKVNFIQHIGEIISLYSVSLKCDLLTKRERGGAQRLRISGTRQERPAWGRMAAGASAPLVKGISLEQAAALSLASSLSGDMI